MVLTGLIISMVLASSGQFREIQDPSGYAFTPEKIHAVIEACEREHPPVVSQGEDPARVVISAHDDHLYSGESIFRSTRGIRARTVLMIGVAHGASRWGIRDRLIFDAFDGWKGPLGTIPVDLDFRDALESSLEEVDFVVSSDHHSEEHSLEALIPFLQAQNPELSIVPILVSPMPWDRMEILAKKLAVATENILKAREWSWGRDFQIVISNDSVHYGDRQWGGKNFAPFGVGIHGLKEAKKRDLDLIKNDLLGPLNASRLKNLLYSLVTEDERLEYRITWCGRFSIPFGLLYSIRLTESMEMSVPVGSLESYTTSVEAGQLDLPEAGLTVSAPANLRHWVGYTSMIYR
ncbi:MAG TPA: AmmeMemoRadiSam system protein B [Thermoanaerobaculia bacterium]|nr:AmmeMemoRadiSam system protein B [Thermoanaerobaculia bacterium]HUM28871.1 AmmeMemoRadiSam system protein B [Thermoanaerobaculia bacterium]HXK67196.1 AmmeMemoRadiSam system protein B [Thermoanaerobaculia bacterium]